MNFFEPELKSFRQRSAGHLSEGDSASVEAGISFPPWLECLAGGDEDARYALPMLAASSAINAILNACPAESFSDFAVSNVSLQWFETPQACELVRATATVTGRLEFFVEGRCGQKVLFNGTIGFSEKTVNVPPFSLFRILSAPLRMPVGGIGSITLELRTSARLQMQVPYGCGLRLLGVSEAHVQPGSTTIRIAADRPDSVNLGSPWILRIVAESEGALQTEDVSIEVPDREPGRIFYILTEDCETFDGGPLTGNYGAADVLGNHNNFMDPEDYLIQMVEKPSRMNQIAEKHGARWTHFWCAPQRFAVDWAKQQSTNGAWEKVADALDQSIRIGSWRHEYAPHLHCDYEPTSLLPPQPRLIYDRETDGILPNDYYHPVSNPTHKYHDWDGAARGGPGIKPLGSWDNVDSKTGSLFKSWSYISKQQARERTNLIARTGSYDFGGTQSDQGISTQAYELLGLRANSDASFPNNDQIPGGHMYWCEREDRFAHITQLKDAGLVQLAVTRDLSFEVLEDVNQWFERHWSTCQGAGLHAIVMMTHAMFMKGEPDPFRSLDGGWFDSLDRHLAWIRENYPDVEFATATEAVTEFLDTYTPEIVSLVDSRLIGGKPEQGRLLFPISLLGRGIYISAESPAEVTLIAPAVFRPGDVEQVIVRNGNQELGRSMGHQIKIAIEERFAALTFEVRVRESAVQRMLEVFGADPLFHDPPEKASPDLAHFKPDPDDVHSLDALRRFVPSMLDQPSGFALAIAGAAVHAAFKMRLDLKPVSLSMDFEAPIDSNPEFKISIDSNADALDLTFTSTEGRPIANGKVLFKEAPKPSRLRTAVGAAMRLIRK